MRNFIRENTLLFFSTLLMSIICIAAIFGPLFIPDPLAQDLINSMLPPLSDGHILGTDPLGRDIFSRIVSGARVSLIVSLLGMIGSLTVGTIMGLVSGARNKWIAWGSDRLIDIQMAFPYILLAIVIVSATTASIPVLIFLMVLAGWASAARVIRSIVLSERPKDYIKAASLVGANQKRILVKYIGPSLVPAILTIAPLQASAMIVMEATLSFLGLGVQPPTPSWGNIIFENQTYFQTAPWLVFLPGLAIVMFALSFNFLGDALRDELDPTQRGREN